MTFYMKTPRGVVNLHILEACVQERLICYSNLKNGNLEVSHFQYLVEDSSLDRSGHFIMRLLAYSSNSFKYDFINNEKKLLEARLNSYDELDMKHCLKRLLKHSREIYNRNEYDSLAILLSNFIRIFSYMCRKKYIWHTFCNGHQRDCKLFTLKVPFYLCLSLVAKREVVLQNGFAEIPCSLGKQLILCLFESYLNLILKILKNIISVSNALEDERIQEILRYVKNYVHNDQIILNLTKPVGLDLTNILEESKYFPLCMMGLFNVLDETNRLAHNERFDFSLFLKDIGMSMSSALTFWEHLYSKKHSTCSRCTHSWQKDEKRYIYGIRHLYGLEGSRKNYQCRNCSYLQEKSVGPRENGGCPFKQFDDTNLRNTLKAALPTKPDEIEVMIYERRNNPTVACNFFLETVYNITTNKNLNQNLAYNNPVSYFLQLKQEIAMGT